MTTGGVLAALGVGVVLAVPADAQEPSVPLAQPAPGRIVYTRGAEGVIDIYTAAPDGTGETRLSDIEESSAGEYQPRFSPDGERVAFATTDTEGLATYWLIPAAGGEPAPVVQRDGQGLDPAWSPDGRCIAFSGAHVSGGAPVPERQDLKVWCEDEPVRTLTSTAAVDEREPEWSPDGARLVFASRAVGSASNRWHLESIAADGSDRRMLLERGVHDRQPRFSPDGSRLAFIASDLADLPIGTLSLLDPDTGAVTALVRRPASSFAWSPDGSELIFGNIDNDGVDVVGSAPLAGRGALDTRPERLLQSTTAKGIYRLVVATGALSRLQGAAGGAESQPNRYDFGFAPDWSAGPATPTPTPTPTATDRPTATATRAASATPSASPTRRASATPTATQDATERVYLPLGLQSATVALASRARAAR